MQVPDMRTLRSVYARKHFFLLNSTKPSKSRQIPQFSRQFRSTTHYLRSEESSFAVDSSFHSEPDSSGTRTAETTKNGRQLWSIYNPVSGRLEMQRSVKENDEQESEPGFLSSFRENDYFESQRTYGAAKKGNLSEGNGTDDGLSNFNREFDNLLKEKRNGGLTKGNMNDRHRTQMGLTGFNDGNDDLLKGRSSASGQKNLLGNRHESRMRCLSYNNENDNLSDENGYGVKKADSVNTKGSGDVWVKRKKGKSRTSWVCEDCGYADGQWWGYCRACQKAGTMRQFMEEAAGSANKVSGIEVSENVVRSWLPQQAAEVRPLRLTDVNRGINQLDWRLSLSGAFGSEVGRVLGGGLVPGSLVLVGGDPGVGKSTLLLQIAAVIAGGQGSGQPAPVVYVSGEESVEQIGNRADRMMIGTEELFLYSSTDIEDILAKIQPLCPRALIVDSIQTVYLKGVSGSAGGLYQVKECTSALLRFAKKTNTPVLLIGHVTKSGDIAGPRVLEHIVDVVLYMEGEKYSSHRLLRPVKNRFGSTDELGVFEMSQSGLQTVTNPSEIFLSEQHSDSEVLAGLAVAVIMDGSRSFLLEVQALCVSGPSVSRHVNGIQANRADMIISVLMKQAGLMLQSSAIFLNVVSGVMLKETAGDLAIAAAICSSFLEFPISNDIAFIGELGLGGELRTVPRMEKRVNTVAKLGYTMCIVPKSAEKSISNLGFEGMKIVGCKNLKEVINTVFKEQK